ncbi:unnamed protein product [Blepharisma stoltei]|uniref:Nucleoporin n=1 Tax=Blepharisma stoltei TaxID=1481888 RepID=A0AAU9JEE7_9CILI|nr:unnamed protein product [Blepharisma stoltei]
MSDSLEFVSAFRDNNEEIYDLVCRGVYHHDEHKIRSALNDEVIKSKLTNLLDFYRYPNDQSARKLESELKWAGTQPLSATMKNFLNQLSLKLNLNQEQTFRLAELFFINHHSIFERVKSQETELVQKELGNLFRPIISLYYKERIYLIRTMTQIVMNTTIEGHPGQAVCLEFLSELKMTKKLEDLIWNQYKAVCKKEIPSQVYAPLEREEWFLQILHEEKELLELLISINYAFAHCSAAQILGYAELYVEQDFRGSYKAILADSHLMEYRSKHHEFVQQISDLSLFHLLSSIRLDIFAEQQTIPEFNPNKNPFNLLANQAELKSIHDFLIGLSDRIDRIPDHISPFMLAWWCLIAWGRLFPEQYVNTSALDIDSLAELIMKFDILNFLNVITKRSPFTGPQTELSCALKYIMLNFVSSISASQALSEKRSKDLLVQVTCACLEKEGCHEALNHFWREHFPNKNGLYSILADLSAVYPHDPEGFLQFVSILVGDSSNSYAEEVVHYLDNLETFTYPSFEENIAYVSGADPRERRVVASVSMKSQVIEIPQGTTGYITAERVSSNAVIVRWEIRYSLWPVLFMYWEDMLNNLKHGNQVSNAENILNQYMNLLCHIIILQPNIGPILERLGLREPANNPSDVKVTDKQKGTPNLELCRLLLDTFIELAKLALPPLETLSLIIDAIKAELNFERQKSENSSMILALKQISEDRYGMINIYTHPLFMNINKLQMTEREAGNYETSISLLDLCVDIISDNSFIVQFPVDSSGLLGEILKFVISEVLPECMNWPISYKWRAAKLGFDFLTVLFKKYNKFSFPQGVAMSLNLQYLDLITNQLNKIDIVEFLANSLQVIMIRSELNELNFVNLHWIRSEKENNDPEELRAIKSMIFSALNTLDEIASLALYSEKIGKEYSLDHVQAIKDVRSLLTQNLGDEETLPLVTALLSYVNFQFSRNFLDDEEPLSVPSLSVLSKVVIYWSLLSQKPTLEHFLTGSYQQIKADFIKYFWSSFSMDQSSDLSNRQKAQAGKAFLEFIIICFPLQKSFVTSACSRNDISVELRSVLVSFAEFSRENVNETTMELLFHYITFYEEIINNHSLFPGIYNSIFQEQGLLSICFDAITNVFQNIKDPQKFEGCLVLHCFSSVMSILLHNSNKNSADKEHAIKEMFKEEILGHLLRLLSKCIANPSTSSKMLEVEEWLQNSGISANITDYAILQLHNKAYWRLFDCNPNQYGEIHYYIDLDKLSLILKTLGVNYELIQKIEEVGRKINAEKSLLDSQFSALIKFKQLFAFLVGYGNSNKPLALLDQTISLENKTLVIAPAKSVIESHTRAFEILAKVSDPLWAEITKEANSRNEFVLKCIEEKYEIIMYAFNLAIHIYQSRQEYSQSSTSSQKAMEYEVTAREEFHRISNKIMTEFAQYFERLQVPSVGAFSLVLVVFGYFIKARTEGLESRAEQFTLAIIPRLARFLNSDSQFFALLVTIFEESLFFLQTQEVINIYKSLPCIRIMLEKISSPKCTDQEFLSVIKFSFAFARTVQGARFLLSERIFSNLASASQLKVKTEYQNRFRDPQHILWCWVLMLLNEMHDILSDDPAFLSQLYNFISGFSDRFQKILSFNLSTEGKYGRQIVAHKQFSLGYLEELDLMTSLIKKFIDNYKYWKASHKEMIESWVILIAQQALRIYSTSIDIPHTFPPVSEHEVKMSNKTVPDQTIEERKQRNYAWMQETPRRSILEGFPNRYREEAIKAPTKIQPSVFAYRVEAVLLSCLTNIMSSLIGIIQISRSSPFLDPLLLLDVGKFSMLIYNKLNQDQKYYKNLEKISNEEYQSAENSLLYGSLNHTYQIDTQKLCEIAQGVFEMAFYLISKSDLGSISDIKSEASYILKEWKQNTSTGIFGGENNDQFLTWLIEQF